MHQGRPEKPAGEIQNSGTLLANQQPAASGAANGEESGLPHIDKALAVLNDTFGYSRFRPLQAEVISQVLSRNDTLVIMPTGGGKSICYQIPALVFDGLTVVVSPLISLMKDQVNQLEELGVPAVYLNSTLSPGQYRDNAARVRSGEIKMLYVAPETLLTDRTRDLLAGVKLDCFTIDEAHCISEWGHDFRPEYRQLASFRLNFPEAACLALTATATPRVREDIRKTLRMDESKVFVAGFDRKNLFLEVTPRTDPLLQISAFLKDRKDLSGIIYCFSRRQVDELCIDLISMGYRAGAYHAGLSEETRTANQEAFIRDDLQIMVATIAFGMGINKPDVRFVIHHDLPQNIESYYQQIGRAGRDGERADCLLLYNYGDTQKIRYFIDQKSEREKLVAMRHLYAMVRYAEETGCRRPELLDYFGETYPDTGCGMCDNCLSPAAKEHDLTEPSMKFLSCVVRTGQSFGASYIADILRGSEARKVISNGHHNLPTHGIGRDWSKDGWMQLSRLLTRQGYLRKDPEYGGLALTPEARNLLRGNVIIEGHLPAVHDQSYNAAFIHKAGLQAGLPVARSGSRSYGRFSDTGDIPAEYDPVLFEKLRKLRKKLADDRGIPPYAVFPDKTLIAMATIRPRSMSELAGIHGVGRKKLDKYGEVFLDAIR